MSGTETGTGAGHTAGTPADEATLTVVRNAALQYSVWPATGTPPRGWETVGFTGTEAECLQYVARTWTDMRPAVRAAGSGRASAAAADHDPRPWHVPVRPGAVDPALSGAVGPRADVPDLGIGDLIGRCAERAPHQVAVRCGDRTMTRRQLVDRSLALAARLVTVGAAPEAPFGVLLPRSVEAVLAIVAVLRSGSPYLPLSTADPVGRLRTILRDAGNPPVLTDTAGRQRLAGYEGPVLLLGDVDDTPAAQATGGPWGRTEPRQADLPAVSGDDLAYIAYTSGTSGPPKGVLATHRQLVNYVGWCAEEFALDPGERALLHAPLYFVGSVMTLFTALTAGWELDVAPEPVAFDELRALARAGRCGFLKLTPSHVRALTTIGEVENLARLFMIGSEPLNLTPALAGWISESPGSRFANHYGMSETVGATCYWIRGDEPAGERLPVGPPILNAEAYVLGPDGRRLPHGEVGELHLAGAVIGRGYHGDPALTAQRWTPHPWGAPGERLLRTGDLARMAPDGTVEILGRADRQVKIRGHRIALPTVEDAVRRCPGVGEVVVTVLPDTQDVPRLTAVLRPAPGERPDIGRLREQLLHELPEPWVPSRFLVTAEFPLTPNGKVDHARLSTTRGLRPDTAGEYRLPRTPAERALCEIFAEVLQLERVGVDDDFLDLGGDSMNVVQAISRAQDLGVEVSIAEFFAHGTPRALATLARTRSDEPTEERPDEPASAADLATGTDPAPHRGAALPDTLAGAPMHTVPVAFNGSRRTAPLTWGQLHMWQALQVYGPEFATLNITRVVDLPAPGASLGDCQRAVQRLVETWESLRTLFADTPEGPRQHVVASGAFPLAVLDVTGPDPDETVRLAARDLAAEPFAHAHQWPVRICLVRTGERIGSVIVVASHVAFDGWSIERLTASLTGWISGDSLDLPAPVHPVDQVPGERSARGRRRDEQAMAHWRRCIERLPGTPVIGQLTPADPPIQRWALRSQALARASMELAARSRTSSSTVLLTVAALATAALQQRPEVALLLISGNRFTQDQRRLAGSALQDALVVYSHEETSLLDAVQTMYPLATEAYFHGRYDPASLEALKAEAASRGALPDLSWFFNDARLGRDWELDPRHRPGADGERTDRGSEPFLVHGFHRGGMSFFLGLAQRGPHCEVALLADTSILPVEGIRHFLTGLESVLCEAVDREMSTGEVAKALLP